MTFFHLTIQTSLSRFDLRKRYFVTFSRLGIVQTLRDLLSALGLSKTLLRDVYLISLYKQVYLGLIYENVGMI